MAVPRTWEEKMDILDHCMELEKTGGDILGYLWSQDYLTPRATWFNYQRMYLHRKPYEFTDGKPKKKGEQTMNGMDSKTIAARQKRLDELKKRIGAGMGIRAALTDMGYTGKSAGQTYRQIRNFAQANDPEIYAILPEKISDADTPVEVKKPETPTVKFEDVKKAIMEIPQIKIDGPLRIETPEANRIQVVETPEKPKAPITQPLVFDGMTVREIEGTYGRYRRTDINGTVYIDFENPDGADILSYTVEQWKKLRVEQANAFRILGVEL